MLLHTATYLFWHDLHKATFEEFLGVSASKLVKILPGSCARLPYRSDLRLMPFETLYRTTVVNAIAAQLVAAAEMNWSRPCGKSLSKCG